MGVLYVPLTRCHWAHTGQLAMLLEGSPGDTFALVTMPETCCSREPEHDVVSEQSDVMYRVYMATNGMRVHGNQWNAINTEQKTPQPRGVYSADISCRLQLKTQQ